MKKIINKIQNNKRNSTQNLMQEIWSAIEDGATDFEINACGQHNIGGSVWSKNGEDLNFYIKNPGQRVGAMGASGTNIYVEGSAPADTGWLNSGAKIVVNGDSVNVIVKADKLEQNQIAQIQNIISREIGTDIENIHISTK